MKEPNYVFATVQYYRNIIDNLSTEEKSSSLFNRGYSKGYFYEKTTKIMNPHFSSNVGERIGIIQGKEIHLEKEVILRSEEHTSELQSRQYLVCRLLLEKKNKNI